MSGLGWLAENILNFPSIQNIYGSNKFHLGYLHSYKIRIVGDIVEWHYKAGVVNLYLLLASASSCAS